MFLPFTKVTKHVSCKDISLLLYPEGDLGDSPAFLYWIKVYAPGKTVAANQGRNITAFVQHLASFVLPVLSGSSMAPYPPHAGLSLTDITGA